MTRRRTVRKNRQHISVLRCILMILIIMGTFEVAIIVVATGRTVTVSTVAGTASRVSVRYTDLQPAVTARIRMAVCAGIVMGITYNVSTARAVMAVRCTARCTGYGRMVAAIV